MDELWDDYLCYLIWKCNLHKKMKYEKLFEILHHLPFTYKFERDGNREGDGLELRDYYIIPKEFSDEIVDAFYDKKCSVLEMLIGLAVRVDNDIIGDPAEDHPEIFFMEMIKNLGLDRFTGDNFREIEVLKIVDRWLNRDFDRNGNGSPFPVKNDNRDQRNLEIWDQVNSYISENYG